MATTTDSATAQDMAQAAGDRAKRCIDGGVNALQTVSGKARDLAGQADGCVRDNPWVAVGVAAGVGALVGFLLGARRNA